MSDKKQAPGELGTVQAFVNTLDVEEDDEQLASPAALAAWLTDHGLTATRSVRATDRRPRERDQAARGAALDAARPRGVCGHPPRAAMELDVVACRSRLRLRFDATAGPRSSRRRSGVDGALGRLLAIVHQAIQTAPGSD